jgi:hypothetical protein
MARESVWSSSDPSSAVHLIGGLAEWLKAAALNTAIGETLSLVRIQYPPLKLEE